eukprot:1160836-Pelagomonas_calceolata.AAC.13
MFGASVRKPRSYSIMKSLSWSVTSKAITNTVFGDQTPTIMICKLNVFWTGLLTGLSVSAQLPFWFGYKHPFASAVALIGSLLLQALPFPPCDQIYTPVLRNHCLPNYLAEGQIPLQPSVSLMISIKITSSPLVQVPHVLACCGPFPLQFMSVVFRAQPPSCYGALVKREEGDKKEEVPGSSPSGRGGEKMPSIGGSRWEALSLMHAAEQQA